MAIVARIVAFLIIGFDGDMAAEYAYQERWIFAECQWSSRHLPVTTFPEVCPVVGI